MPSAAHLYVKKLLPAFRELRYALHPWWWPKESSCGFEDWGLTEEQVAKAGCDPQTVHDSLRLGPKLIGVADGYYSGFPGGVADHGDGQAIVWALSSRPSDEAFPNKDIVAVGSKINSRPSGSPW